MEAELAIIQKISNLIKKGKVCALVGAGISVNSGIPDFRSPGGMYDTLKPDLLTATLEQRKMMASEPSAVVSWNIFKENQLPYLELRRPFILGIQEGKWKPTLCHFFLKELEERQLLQRLYTQNIDGLDYKAGITKIVSCHGSLGNICCEFCKSKVDPDLFAKQLQENIKDIYSPEGQKMTSKPIPCSKCKENGLKPDTVLYGRPLPQEFFQAMEEDFETSNDNVNLMMVIGTSLTVGPANLVPCEAKCQRVVLNMEPVGDLLGIKYASGDTTGKVTEAGRDVFFHGPSDEMILKLIRNLDWVDSIKSKYGDQMADKSRDILFA